MKKLAFLLTASLLILPGCWKDKKCNDSTCTQPAVPMEEQPGIRHVEGSTDTNLGSASQEDITMCDDMPVSAAGLTMEKDCKECDAK